MHRCMGPPKQKPKIVVICGPTAVGKTSFAIELAEAAGGEIVSADSMQVYRQMDIGTAKPTGDELSRMAHHMIDVANPDEPFDAEKYASMAREAVNDILARHRTPFVAGGTGLYIKTLVHGLFRTRPMEMEIRNRLKKEAEAVGTHSLHRRLVRLDSAAAARIHPNDLYRVLRALEVLELTGRPLSEFHRAHAFAGSPFNVFKIGLCLERKTLYGRIDRRVDAMIDDGFVEEVRGLIDQGYPVSLKSMQSIGYRHMGAYLSGHMPWQEAVRTMKRDTRRYAKRQLTWFGKETDIQWANPERPDDVSPQLERFLVSGP
jgi:tRNA dimethylallyltransferase